MREHSDLDVKLRSCNKDLRQCQEDLEKAQSDANYFQQQATEASEQLQRKNISYDKLLSEYNQLIVKIKADAKRAENDFGKIVSRHPPSIEGVRWYFFFFWNTYYYLFSCYFHVSFVCHLSFSHPIFINHLAIFCFCYALTDISWTIFGTKNYHVTLYFQINTFPPVFPNFYLLSLFSVLCVLVSCFKDF